MFVFSFFRVSQKKKGDSLVIVKRMSVCNYCPSVSHCTLRRQTATLKFMRRHVLFPVIRHSHTTRDNNNCFLFASSNNNNNNNDDNLTGYCAKNLLQRVRIVSFSLWSALDFCQGDRSDGPPRLCRAISLGRVAWLTEWLPGWLDSLAIITSSIIQRSAAKLCASRHSSSFFLTFSSFFAALSRVY